ncbi:hypothetical protein SAMN02982929_01201 [Saccharopolyspora kobensis]|uniref:Uncharacterized protein n=1 Tax=Saccharopolyspora kobensis TaxID=146035 RepID=A0A1H5WJ77_9PSEU|nr:DUF6463 family protein [Saccharopolyspora kobensis]SEF99350.1 hypothetical protein SAMN02982929_01201 [Saccharopolyspora kobensis]SFD76212.1 hypothetical protein SAMN05216506_106176 [Saccharopolyspora kobensis]
MRWATCATDHGTTTMNTRKRLLRWASAIMLVLGAGHLSLIALISSAQFTDWLYQGLWATVPLADIGTAPTVEALQDKVAFWGGPGSFAVPLILLACLIWHLAGRGASVPAGIGWALLVWCTLAGIVLVPSPYFAGTIAGALIVLATRTKAPQRQAAADG